MSLAQFKWADGTVKQESVFLPEESITRLKLALKDLDLSSLYLLQRLFASSTSVCSRHGHLQSSLCYGNWNLSRLRETSFSLHRDEDEICGVNICLCRQRVRLYWEYFVKEMMSTGISSWNNLLWIAMKYLMLERRKGCWEEGRGKVEEGGKTENYIGGGRLRREKSTDKRTASILEALQNHTDSFAHMQFSLTLS